MPNDQKNAQDELMIDVSRLSETEMEALAALIVRKLRDLIRQESDRSGR